MKVSIRELNKIIKEEIATLNKDAIEDTVMDVLSEAGDAGFKVGDKVIANGYPGTITDLSIPGMATVDLGRQGETTVSLSDVEMMGDDYVDTTQLESKRVNISKKQLKRIVRESMEELPPPCDRDWET